MTPLVPILLTLAGAMAAAALRRRPGPAWWVVLTTAGLATAATVRVATAGFRLHVPWVPEWGAFLALEPDPLGSLLAVLAASIGVLVLLYSGPYVRHHLEEHGREQGESVRYYVYMLLFMGSMLGLAFSGDFLLLFLFFDLTAVWSYLLIGFDRESPEARVGALTALLTTGVTSVALLAAALLWRAETGTFELAGLATAIIAPGTREWLAALVVLAALAKSAQVPFHFWLPRAMAAPTPVSAYLHSAAMVAAGVFVLLRLYPSIEGTTAAAFLPWLGLVSILVGSVLALGADPLKELLAYSTVAQYGYVVLLIGLGGASGVSGAALYLAVHGLAKSALFLTAGAVGQATGRHRLSELGGGLGRRMPWVAGASALAAATLAGLAPTVGYFKDEALFKAALEHGPVFGAAATLGVMLTVAYTARFWIGTFVGGSVDLPHAPERHVEADVEHPATDDRGPAAEGARPPAAPPVRERPHPLLVAPIVVLSVVCALGAVEPSWLSSLASSAGSSAAARPAEIHVAFALNLPLLLALVAYAGGAGVYLARRRWMGAALAFRRAGRKLGAEALYDRSVAGLNRFSSRVHELEVRDLRDRVASILLPAGALILAAFFVVARDTRWRVGAIYPGHAPILPAFVALGVAGLATMTRRTHLGLVLALSAVGFTLAGVYALLGAPELALVTVLVETVFTILLLAVFGVIPRGALRRDLETADGEAPLRVQERRHRWAGAIGGAAAFVVTWAVLSVQDEGGVAAVHEAAAEYAHAPDAVSAILADFRGLDTAGEVTVIALALLGLSMLLGSGRGS